MSFQLPALNFNDIGFFMDVANKYPKLSACEERELFNSFSKNKNQDSFNKLVLSNLRFVGYIAKKYSGYGVPVLDLAQEGVIGLIKGIKNFDASFNVRITSFAVYSIKYEMNEYVLKNYSSIKIASTKAERKLFFNKRKLNSPNLSLSNKEISEIASDLKIKESEVIQMEKRVRNTVISLDSPATEDADQKENIIDTVSYSNSIAFDPVESIENENNESKMLKNCLEVLDDRSKDIIKRRWLEDKKSTLTELANEYSVSAERVRQIEKKAIKTIKNNIPSDYLL